MFELEQIKELLTHREVRFLGGTNKEKNFGMLGVPTVVYIVG